MLVAVLTLLVSACSGQLDVAEQDCEMCGLLVYHLHTLATAGGFERKKVDDGGSRPSNLFGRSGGGVRDAARVPAHEVVPAELVVRFQTFLDHACESEIARIRLCSANGDDASKLRNPTAVPFEAGRCRIRLQERCEHVARSHAPALMSAAYVDRNATACASLMPTTPACTPQRATLLLGPLYGKEESAPGAASWLPMNAGLKDVWRYLHGFYHNAARCARNGGPRARAVHRQSAEPCCEAALL